MMTPLFWQNGANSAKITIRLKPLSYDGVQSSLAHLYFECDFECNYNDITKDLWKKIGAFKKGNRQKGAKERQNLGLCVSEGKDLIPLQAYIHLAMLLHKSDDPEHIAAHLFLLLDWNLISWADMVATSNIKIVRLWNDTIKLQIGLTKADQTGSKNNDKPFHVYSIQGNPIICPLVAFAKHLVCNPHILQGNCPIFEGSNQYDRIDNILQEIVLHKDNKDTFKHLGLNARYFGTHSIWKGAATHVASGTTACPPMKDAWCAKPWHKVWSSGRLVLGGALVECPPKNSSVSYETLGSDSDWSH